MDTSFHCSRPFGPRFALAYTSLFLLAFVLIFLQEALIFSRSLEGSALFGVLVPSPILWVVVLYYIGWPEFVTFGKESMELNYKLGSRSVIPWYDVSTVRLRTVADLRWFHRTFWRIWGGNAERQLVDVKLRRALRWGLSVRTNSTRMKGIPNPFARTLRLFPNDPQAFALALQSRLSTA